MYECPEYRLEKEQKIIDEYKEADIYVNEFGTIKSRTYPDLVIYPANLYKTYQAIMELRRVERDVKNNPSYDEYLFKDILNRNYKIYKKYMDSFEEFKKNKDYSWPLKK